MIFHPEPFFKRFGIFLSVHAGLNLDKHISLCYHAKSMI